MKFLLVVAWVTLGVVFPAGGGAFQTGGDEENPFRLSYDEGPVTLKVASTSSLLFSFEIPANHYLYAESIEVTLTPDAPIRPKPLVKPTSIEREDPFFGKTVPVYFDRVEVTLPFDLPPSATTGDQTITGEIQFQGCSDLLCYRVMHVPFEIAATIEGEGGGKEGRATGFIDRVRTMLTSGDAASLFEGGLLVALLVAFLGGVLTDFTPCVWPIIPITLAVIGVRKEKGVWRNLATVSVLIVGMAVMYSLLGVVSALLGRGLGFLFQNLFFLILLVVVLVAMALSLFGLFELRLPSSLQTKISKVSPRGLKGIFFVGLTVGIIASPCVGPVVGPLLVYVAQTRSLVTGLLLLFAYALGMGSLFLLLGLFYGELTKIVRSGAWMEWLKKGLGLLLLVVAVYYSHVIYETLFQGKESGLESPWDVSSVTEGLKRAKEEEKPVVVDFYATWCPPCMELDSRVWSQPEIAKRLDERWIAIKIDCTKETDSCKEAVDRFSVVGWPTVLFLDAGGDERSDERLVGKVVTADEMKKILERVEGETK